MNNSLGLHRNLPAERYRKSRRRGCIYTRSRNGRGRGCAGPLEILEAIEPAGFALLSVTCEHAARVGELPPLHRDPFDRMLVAQALTEPLILLTNDPLLVGYGSCVTLV